LVISIGNPSLKNIPNKQAFHLFEDKKAYHESGGFGSSDLIAEKIN